MRWAKAGLFVLSLLPLGYLVVAAASNNLGANPVESITHVTGEWALRFLLITLAVTPLRQLFGWNRLLQLRRMLGLFAFFYACMHFCTWLIFDHFFEWRGIVEDVLERPYITLGASALLLLLPLAVTSTNGWMRRLGKRWVTLHRLVYPAALIAVVHFLWLVKADYREPLVYAAILVVLLGYRLLPEHWWKRSTAKRRSTTARAARSLA
jgi:sulfoxide reductase heme-binding subunit YedZ